MIYIQLLLGALLPMLAGVLVVSAWLGARAHWSLQVGTGSFLGVIATALFVYLWGQSGLPMQNGPMLAAWAVLLTLAVLIRLRVGLPRLGFSWVGRQQLNTSRILQLVVVLLLILTVARTALLIIEVLHRPLFPFDATTAWATKAKVWFFQRELVPFVDKDIWLAAATESGVFTDHRPGYPIVTPLLQLWTALVIDQWNVSLINLPWLACFISLVFLFYGASRDRGLSRIGALLLTYMLTSLPLLNSHVALAGYADLFAATAVLGTWVYALRYCETRAFHDLLLLALFALIAPLVKNEGLFWSSAILPLLAFALFPLRKAWMIVGCVGGAAVTLLFLIPGDLVIAGHSLDQLNIHYRPGAALAVLRSWFSVGSWHLVYYFAIVAAFSFPSLAPAQRRRLWPLVGVLLLCHLLLGFLFVFTGYAPGAMRLTAVNRINLAFLPGLLLCIGLIGGEVINGRAGVFLSAQRRSGDMPSPQPQTELRPGP